MLDFILVVSKPIAFVPVGNSPNTLFVTVVLFFLETSLPSLSRNTSQTFRLKFLFSSTPYTKFITISLLWAFPLTNFLSGSNFIATLFSLA